jgi:adenylyltransferase/sulfurtransferase
LYLTAAGVGTIGLLDHDRVDRSNLQRQVLYATDDIGRLKVEVAHERLSALNPEIHISTHGEKLCEANVRSVFAQYDIVLDGTDRFAARYLTNDACVILRKPLVAAAIHRFQGQLFTYVPGRGPCYRCLFAEPPRANATPNCAEAGVLGVLPGVLGALQATEAIKLIVDRGEALIGRLLSYDALSMRFNEFSFTRNADCAVCGDRPTIVAPMDMSSGDAIAIRQVRPRELHELMRTCRVALIDVREPDEFVSGHLCNSINIPLSTLDHRAAELPTNQLTVFICRTGARSAAACELLTGTSLSSVASLEGGLLAWTAEIDDA